MAKKPKFRRSGRRSTYFGGGFSQESFARPSASRKPPKSILIVTEGEVSEPLYFKSLALWWRLHPHVVSIKAGGEGIPGNLVKKALLVQKQRERLDRDGELAFNQAAKFDETWIVFDTEHAERMNHLHDGIEEARTHGILIAHSTPCFEFWFCLHYAPNAPPMSTCDEAVALLKKLSGRPYSKNAGASKVLIDLLLPSVPEAVTNALVVERNQMDEDFPPNPSTTVHDLVYSLHDTLPDELKDRFKLPNPK